MFSRILPPVALALSCACATSPPPAPDSPPKTVRVAACQIRVDSDREAAFERIDAALREASEQGAQIACFPETCLLGWANPDASRLADPIPGPSSNRLAALARRHQIMIAIGLAERAGERLYDAAILIDRDGTLLLHHRKVIVQGEPMEASYTPGEASQSHVVETRYGRLGLLICDDTFEDELLTSLAGEGLDLLLVPFGWAAPASDWPEHGSSLRAWVKHAALSTGAPTLGVDSTGTLGYGPWKGYVLGGQSTLSDADGSLHEPLADREREVRVFELPWPR